MMKRHTKRCDKSAKAASIKALSFAAIAGLTLFGLQARAAENHVIPENTKSANEMSKDFDLSGISMSSDFNNDNITISDKNSLLRDTAQVKNQVFAKSQTDFNTLRYDMLGVTSSDGASNTLSQEARKTTVGTQQTKTVIKSTSKMNSAKSRNLARFNQIIGG